eukprot:3308130-Rhodomonas_salina.2
MPGADSDYNHVLRPGSENYWMYDVVNNVDSGLDVDRLDYLPRDRVSAVGMGGRKEVAHALGSYARAMQCPRLTYVIRRVCYAVSVRDCPAVKPVFAVRS